jgi:osmoprotectant transport system ATP-binding protein
MIEFVDVCKSYGSTNVINNLNLKILRGELLVLVGESGCGKTTIIQMINRLIEPDGGKIFIDDVDIATLDSITLRRKIGYVIQDIGLFPHYTIEENISLLLKIEKNNKALIQTRTRELMQIINLPYEQYAKKYPKQLSGGQRQRIGVARALANNAEIIIMDEPFSALDPITRKQLQNELLSIHARYGTTIVFVTHDIDEAVKIGDRVAIMQNGEILQLGTPLQIIKHPLNEFVRTFIGKHRLWKTPQNILASDLIASFSVYTAENTLLPTVAEDYSLIKVLEIMTQSQSNACRVLTGENTFLGIITNESITQKLYSLMPTSGELQ